MKVNSTNTLNGIASLNDSHIMYVDESGQKLMQLNLKTNQTEEKQSVTSGSMLFVIDSQYIGIGSDSTYKVKSIENDKEEWVI
jgi:hypothetical protein